MATLKRRALAFDSEFSYLKAGVDYSVPPYILSIGSFGIECFFWENFDAFIVAEAGCSECRSLVWPITSAPNTDSFLTFYRGADATSSLSLYCFEEIDLADAGTVFGEITFYWSIYCYTWDCFF